MEGIIRIGSVSYLNALPLLFGLRKGLMAGKAILSIDYPSAIASDLVSGKIDVGLVPVAVIPQLREYHIVTDYGIGCNGDVVTVGLFSDVPIEEISEVMLDYQSRSSVALVQILLKHHWNISPKLIPAYPGYEDRIQGRSAGVVIGDRAFVQRNRSKYTYDLGRAWKDFTGLPFLFAAWIANKKLTSDFISDFNEANQYGLSHIDEVVKTANYDQYDLQKYFTTDIDYHIDSAKLLALEKYLKYLSADHTLI